MADCVIEALPPCTRIVLRAAPGVAAALSGAFGVALPPPMLTAAHAGSRTALRLGPDEMLLLAEPGAALSGGLSHPDSSAVDVSDRHLAFRLAGRDSAELLNEGCPLDLDPGAFPVGACSRTLFGKAEIVLWRFAANGFHVEVARSFAPYLRALLDEALSDLG